MSVRVVIVDDDGPYREALAELLALEPSFEVVAAFGDPRELLRFAGGPPDAPFDVVLMDIEMPGLDGIAATARWKAARPGVPVVMLTAFEDPDRILRAIAAGADGYLVKRADGAQVVDEIRAVVEGGSPMTPSVARSVLASIRERGSAPGQPFEGRPDGRLSDREVEVLRLLVAGRSYKEIAGGLGISVDTVRTHIRRIYGKLQVHSAPEAVARAIRERMV